jgi:LacI family transcriptional regulator
MNAEKKAQILKLIEETGYVPNKAAQNMVLRRSFAIGIVIPDMFNNFQRQLFSIVERQLESLGYHSMFFFVKFDAVSEKDCLTHVKSEILDGVIMFHEVKDPHFFEYLAAAKIPVVSTLANESHIPTIKLDDCAATIEGLRHLIGLGHRRIAMICGSGFFSFGKKRLEGYHKALEAHGVPLDEALLVHAPQYSFEAGVNCMRELLLRRRDFSAVFASSDELAIGALGVLLSSGIRVPQDISLLGFDDIDLSRYVYPPLTTIKQPIREIGEQATQLLHRLITGNHNVETEVIVPHGLVIRESTCAVLQTKASPIPNVNAVRELVSH